MAIARSSDADAFLRRRVRGRCAARHLLGPYACRPGALHRRSCPAARQCRNAFRSLRTAARRVALCRPHERRRSPGVPARSFLDAGQNDREHLQLLGRWRAQPPDAGPRRGDRIHSRPPGRNQRFHEHRAVPVRAPRALCRRRQRWRAGRDRAAAAGGSGNHPGCRGIPDRHGGSPNPDERDFSSGRHGGPAQAGTGQSRERPLAGKRRHFDPDGRPHAEHPAEPAGTRARAEGRRIRVRRESRGRFRGRSARADHDPGAWSR